VADTIHEQIAAKVATAIHAVDGATCIRRTRRKISQPIVNGLVILFQDDPQPDAECPHGWQQWDAPFTAQAFVVLDDTDTTPVDTELNNLRGKIEAAVMADPQWATLALETAVLAPVTSEADEAYDLVQVNFRIKFRHLILDPFSQT